LKAQALIGRARSHNRKEDDTHYLEAVADATEAARIDPTLAAAHKERAIALYNLEEYEAALEAFRKAEANESTSTRAKAAFREWVRMCQTKLGEELDPSLHQTGAISSPAPSHATTTNLPPTTTIATGENKAGHTETIDGPRKIVIGDKEFKVDNLKQYQELLSSLVSSSSLDDHNNQKDTVDGGGNIGPKLQQLIREQGRRATTTNSKISEQEEQEEEGPQKVHVRIDDEEYSKYWNKSISSAATAVTTTTTTTTTTTNNNNNTAASGYRHQWFQSSDQVEVDILARNVKKEQVKVDIKEGTLYVRIAPLDSNSKGDDDIWEFKVDLYGPVVPEECKYGLLSSKVEIKLKKAAPLHEWKTLEKISAGNDGGGGNAAADVSSSHAAATATPHPPAPYSSGKSLTDWNKIGKSAEEEEESHHDPMKFFKELYQNADEDTRRAMLKSYQQSGGTSLTTNWNDAASKDFTPTNESVNADVKKFEV
jgi:suppressor of G2 allele of SKP1